eukprot:TRINITY_DN12793_c0_g1_i1.p1 TRINITY_DN12793_c0_g1~~TRINITY_DN12793_c0_g1_i1.p1  ORF type:complete len:449 (+),score=96.50 TRINITY_DN12793_c0_g1_i1:166-1512(+)
MCIRDSGHPASFELHLPLQLSRNMGDTINIDGEEIDLSKLTERQQIALLLRQSEEEAKKPSQTSRRKPPSTPRSRSKDDGGHTLPGSQSRPPSSGKREASRWGYEEFASDSAGAKDGLWTPREHQVFMGVVEAHAGSDIKWSAVTDKLGGRTEQQCADYMQRLLDRGLIKYDDPPAPVRTRPTPDEEPTQKRARTAMDIVSPQTRGRANTVPTYRRVRSDEIPALLQKVPSEELKERSKALLARIEESEERLAQLVSEAEPPELTKIEPEAAPAEEHNPEHNESLDPELVLQHSTQRAALQASFQLEMHRLAVWFKENSDRESFEGDDEATPSWDRAMRFLKENRCLAPIEPTPTPQPPKKRLAKLLRQYEHVKGSLIKKQQEEARTLCMVQAWRVAGCKAPQSNEEVLKLYPDPTILNLPTHIVGQTVQDFPSVKVHFPYYVKQTRP